MATMKFTLVSLTLFVLLKAYNARNLHDVSTKGSLDGRPIFEASVIQMVTRDEKITLPPSFLPQDETTYGRVNKPPPPPKGAPSKINMIYGGDNPSLKQESSLDQTKYGRDDPRTPPSPNPNDSNGHGMYNRVNPSAPATSKSVGRIHPLVSDGVSVNTGLSSSAIKHRSVARLSNYVTRIFNIGVNL